MLTSTVREWLETETENRLQGAQAGKPNELKALLGLGGGPSNNIKTTQMEIHKRIQFLWTDINSQSSTTPHVLIDLLLLALQWLSMYYKGLIAIRGFLCKTYSEYEHWAEYLQEVSELSVEIHEMREAAKTNIKKLNSIILGLSGKEENYETRVLAVGIEPVAKEGQKLYTVRDTWPQLALGGVDPALMKDAIGLKNPLLMDEETFRGSAAFKFYREAATQVLSFQLRPLRATVDFLTGACE